MIFYVNIKRSEDIKSLNSFRRRPDILATVHWAEREKESRTAWGGELISQQQQTYY